MKRFHGGHIACLLIIACICASALCPVLAFADTGVSKEATDVTTGIVEAKRDATGAAKANADAKAQDSPAATDDSTKAAASSEDADVRVTPSPESAKTEGDASTDTPLAAMAKSGTVDMLRLYNPNSGEHFYTGSSNERTSLVDVGWKYEGIGWVAPKTSSSPVYRLYNPNAGDHHYTLSATERDSLVREGWKDEGIGWYSDDRKGVAVLRQYNPNAEAGAHNFTTSKDENDALVKEGWSAEGIGWYAVADDDPTYARSKIYLDAGHGMGSSAKGVYDSGALGNGYEEAKLTAELVELVAQYARDIYGLDVYSNVDSNLEYWNRQDDAKERGCTSLVSIHFNASDSGGTGSESYIHSNHAAERADELQEIMHEALVKGMGLLDRGTKSSALAVCSGYGTGIPAVLLEICFIDNSYDMEQYQEKKDSLARELAAGLYEASQNGF